MLYLLNKRIKQLKTQSSVYKKMMMMVKGKTRLWYSKARPRANALNLMLKNLNLRYSTWLSKLVGQGRPSC